MENKRNPKLSPKMTVAEFDAGYWYCSELKGFAKEIGVPQSSKLRKDELEKAIRSFLKTGKVKLPTRRNLSRGNEKDSDAGLSPRKRVRNYTNNRETKDWIVEHAKRLNPDFKERSGSRYRLNRWREEQITEGNPITYGDLAKQYVILNEPDLAYEKIPTGRYINFLSEFLKKEKGATREEAIACWHELKRLDVPKTYSAWKKSVAGKPSA